MAASPRSHLAGLGRAEHGGFDERERRDLGLGDRPVIDFSASTNPFGPPPGVAEAFRNADITRYPDPEARELREAIAARHGVPASCVLVGNGSVELIWLAATAYLEPGRRALIYGPTFGEYEAAARAAGADVCEIRADEAGGFRHAFEVASAPMPEYPRSSTAGRRSGVPQYAVAYMCNPNNPTGVVTPPRVIRTWCAHRPDTLLVVDEAYLPFAMAAPSCLDAGPLPDNLLILRSLTKDCAIPGLRLGYCIGAQPVIEVLRSVQPPWTVNAPAQAAGVAALQQQGYLDECLLSIRETRGHLVEGLQNLGLPVHPGEANFILARTGDATGFRRRLLREGCCVRDCTSFGLPDHVRIAVRTPRECETLLAATARVLADAG